MRTWLKKELEERTQYLGRIFEEYAYYVLDNNLSATDNLYKVKYIKLCSSYLDVEEEDVILGLRNIKLGNRNL